MDSVSGAGQDRRASESEPEGWRQAVDREIDRLGWAASTKIESTGSGVTLYMIDVFPDKDRVFTPEGPATFSLSVFLSGSGTFSVDGAMPFSFETGSAVLFSCNRTTRGTNVIHGGRRLTVVDLRFETPLLEMLGGLSLSKFGGQVMTDHSLPGQDIFLVGLRASPALLRIAADVINSHLPDGLARRLFLHSKAIEALGLAIAALSQEAGGRKVRPLASEERRKLENAIRLIETSYGADWTIARLAREVGLNEKRLKEGFRRSFGRSVHEHLRHVRLDAAASLLSERMSVTETALSVGFNNLSHFSKVFREHTGVSPNRYRYSTGGVSD